MHFFQTAFFFYFADGALFDGFAGFQVAFGQIVHSQTFDSQQAVALPDDADGSLDLGTAGFEYCEQLFYIIVEYGSCKGLGMVEQPQDKLFGGLKFPVFERKGGFLSEIRLFCQEKTAIFEKYFIHLQKIRIIITKIRKNEYSCRKSSILFVGYQSN